MKKILQLIPDTRDTFAFYGEPNTIGIPTKVRFFALYSDSTISAFVIGDDDTTLSPAESLENFLYLQ